MKSYRVVNVKCKLICSKSGCATEIVNCSKSFRQDDNSFDCRSFFVDWTTYLTKRKYLIFLKDNWNDNI